MRNDVLIIGAGPSGLFAAAELARHGVTARLVEREVRPHREARATAIQPGTLKILDSVGVLALFLDAAEHVRCARLYGPDMVELGAMSHDGIDCLGSRERRTTCSSSESRPTPRRSRSWPDAGQASWRSRTTRASILRAPVSRRAAWSWSAPMATSASGTRRLG